jgi:hypothetical protein
MRVTVAWLTMSLLAATLSAQQPDGPQDAAQARQLLHSAQWKDKAWGAYFAGQLHSAELAADLVEQFQANAIYAAASVNSEEYAFIASLFDGAIESGVRVPAGLLEPFEENWREPVLVLLSLSGTADREESFLRLRRAPSDVAWLAANNLLFGMRSQRWYIKILGELRVSHQYTVVSPGQAPLKGRGRLGSMVCGDGITAIPKGFPPIALYVLQVEPNPSLVTFAPGPMDVRYRKLLVPTDGQNGFGSCFSVDREKMDVDYLAALGRMRSDQAQELFRRDTPIPYSNHRQFRRAVQQSLAAQEKGVQDLLQAIQQSEKLTGSGVELQVLPVVSDQRQTSTTPLPTVEPLRILIR